MQAQPAQAAAPVEVREAAQPAEPAQELSSAHPPPVPAVPAGSPLGLLCVLTHWVRLRRCLQLGRMGLLCRVLQLGWQGQLGSRSARRQSANAGLDGQKLRQPRGGGKSASFLVVALKQPASVVVVAGKQPTSFLELALKQSPNFLVVELKVTLLLLRAAQKATHARSHRKSLA